MVHGLDAEYGDRIQFSYVDVDDSANNDLYYDLGHGVIPEYYLLDAEGNVLAHWIGTPSESEFREAFEEALGN